MTLRERLRKIYDEIFVHLVVAVFVAAGTYGWTRLLDQKKIEAAPAIYVAELDKLINNAVSQGEDHAIENAKAIVQVRNSLAQSLGALGKLLDSQTDVLAEELGLPRLETSKMTETPTTIPDKHRVYLDITILQKIWPAKRRQIEVEIRKLFAELGLYGTPGKLD